MRFLLWGFLAGLFGWPRPVHVHTNVIVDADSEAETYVYDNDCDASDYAADAVDDVSYDDSGSSVNSEE